MSLVVLENVAECGYPVAEIFHANWSEMTFSSFRDQFRPEVAREVVQLHTTGAGLDVCVKCEISGSNRS